MAPNEVGRTAQPSLLDRLIDTEPTHGADAPISLAESVRRAKAALRRDIEWLLNTRRTAEPAPAELGEVARSVYQYGIPDLTSLSHDAPDDRTRLLRAIQETLTAFEPRLADVRVRIVEGETPEHRRELHFVIEGTFRMDPTPERVSYDTVLELTMGECRVRGERA